MLHRDIRVHEICPNTSTSVWRFTSIFYFFFSPTLRTVSNTRFIAAVIERHTHSPERRRRYWGRSGTESDHGNDVHMFISNLWPENVLHL